MKPFLLLATRSEDVPADEEYGLFLRYTGLDERDLIRVRMEAGPLPPVDLDALSGIFVGGGPFNASDPPASKSPVQHRVEAEFAALLDARRGPRLPVPGRLLRRRHASARTRAPSSTAPSASRSRVIEVTRTDEGRGDALLAALPDTFTAFVGHKEAISVLPPSATLLATSPGCPVQMFRVGQNVYATQFHPELDVEGITTRIHAYAGHGYFEGHELQDTLTAVRRMPVTQTGEILRAFVERYAR